MVRARLRELPVIYILILGMATFWRRTFLGDHDLPLYAFDAVVMAALVGVIALLSGRRPVSLPWLKAIELGMIAMLAARVCFVQYRVMLVFSLHEDRMMAQLTMKNIVLLTSILILTYGLYVPKSWRRAALVVGPLALMPFVTLLILSLRYPAEMGWLGRGWSKSDTPRIALFSFDAMLLAIVALGSAYGARTMSLLRRQVAEARQLGQYRLGRRLGVGVAAAAAALRLCAAVVAVVCGLGVVFAGGAAAAMALAAAISICSFILSESAGSDHRYTKGCASPSPASETAIICCSPEGTPVSWAG